MYVCPRLSYRRRSLERSPRSPRSPAVSIKNQGGVTVYDLCHLGHEDFTQRYGTKWWTLVGRFRTAVRFETGVTVVWHVVHTWIQHRDETLPAKVKEWASFICVKLTWHALQHSYRCTCKWQATSSNGNDARPRARHGVLWYCGAVSEAGYFVYFICSELLQAWTELIYMICNTLVWELQTALGPKAFGLRCHFCPQCDRHWILAKGCASDVHPMNQKDPKRSRSTKKQPGHTESPIWSCIDSLRMTRSSREVRRLVRLPLDIPWLILRHRLWSESSAAGT